MAGRPPTYRAAELRGRIFTNSYLHRNPVPSNLHPFVQLIISELKRQEIPANRFEQALGASHGQIRALWRGARPSLPMVEKMLDALGFTITIQPKSQEVQTSNDRIVSDSLEKSSSTSGFF